MIIAELPLSQLREASWNPNCMNALMKKRLKESVIRFDVLRFLVVRSIGAGVYEVLAGNKLLGILREMGRPRALCAVVEVGDTHARLLAQALNHIHGEDDLGLRAEVMRDVLASIPEEEVRSLLPETAGSLKALTSLGQQDMASHVRAWQQAQEARLYHLTFQLTKEELALVEQALDKAAREVRGPKGDNPNSRGRALALICRFYLE